MNMVGRNLFTFMLVQPDGKAIVEDGSHHTTTATATTAPATFPTITATTFAADTINTPAVAAAAADSRLTATTPTAPDLVCHVSIIALNSAVAVDVPVHVSCAVHCAAAVPHPTAVVRPTSPFSYILALIIL